MWWNQKLSRSERFSRLTFAICPLGTVNTVRSNVRRRVERNPMFSTVPSVSPTFKRSPTRTAPSKMMEAPPITFSRVFCAASATAIPPTPSPANVALGLTPK